MFTARITEPHIFGILLQGHEYTVVENDEQAGGSSSVFAPGDSCGIPENGTHWMILNGEKFMVQVNGNSSEPDGCPCCAWWWVSFKIVG